MSPIYCECGVCYESIRSGRHWDRNNVFVVDVNLVVPIILKSTKEIIALSFITISE